MQDIERTAHRANIGTFWLTVIILVLMGVQIYQGSRRSETPKGDPKTAQVDPPANLPQSGGVAMSWLMPSILAASLLVAGGLNFVAARKRVLAGAPLERAIEDILLRKGVLPDSPQVLPATSVAASESLPGKDAKLDGEAYRIVTAPKGAFADMTRQFIEGMGKEFAIDVDVLIQLYIVNISTETQYIKDFYASVEIDGKRIEMSRQKDFDAWEVNGNDYEYCLDPDPTGSKFELEKRAETLIPIFISLPIELNPRKPLEGWVRFLLKEVDPKKLEDNRTYAFTIVDSLGDEYLITRFRLSDTVSRISARRKGVHK